MVDPSHGAALVRRGEVPTSVRDGFDELPMPAVIVDSPHFHVAATNAAHRALTGHEELVGRSLEDAFPGFPGRQLSELAEQARATGEPVTARKWRAAPDDSDEEGRELYVDLALLPRPGAGGEIETLLIQQFDVTDRVRDRRSGGAAGLEAHRPRPRAQDVVIELQKALLPADLPTLPQARVAARYLVAEREQAAGGDWLEALPLDGGDLALAVGDVVGHGVAAAAAMGQLRAVLGEALLDSGDVENALGKVDALAARSPAMRASTVCLIVVNPDSGHLRYGTCGHPPPLIVRPDGSSRYLRGSGGAPLGTGATVTVATDVLGPGETLVLYSDGLIERPGHTLDDGMAALADVARDAVLLSPTTIGDSPSVAERVCALSSELLARTGYDDDITVLAAERRPQPLAPLHLTAPATLEGVAHARAALGPWLEELEPTRTEFESLELAVTELLANSVEHAYHNLPPGPIQLDASIRPDGVLQLVVADQGRWRPPASPTPSRGRGLWLADACVDDMHIAHDDDASPADGTTVTLRRRLRRPVILGHRPPGDAPHQRADAELHMTYQEGLAALFTVTGPIDISTAPEFSDRLETASRGGQVPLSIDMSGVDLLASAGVRVLIDLRDQYAKHGHQLVLLAASNTPAQTVLDLVGLSWSDTDRATESPDGGAGSRP